MIKVISAANMHPTNRVRPDFFQYPIRPMTHDGFSELWFDDLESLRRVRSSPEWAALSEDGRTLFSYPMSVVVAHEAVIKAEW